MIDCFFVRSTDCYWGPHSGAGDDGLVGCGLGVNETRLLAQGLAEEGGGERDIYTEEKGKHSMSAAAEHYENIKKTEARQ